MCILDYEKVFENYLLIIYLGILCHYSGFPGGASGKEPACQCRGDEFDPWSEKISHTVGQISLCATTTEVML